MKFKIESPLNKYTSLELALLVMLGQFGNGQERRNNLGARYNDVQSIVEYLAVGIVPKVNYETVSDEQIKKAFAKIKPTESDYDEMISDFIKAL